jgi:hypothetical protein
MIRENEAGDAVYFTVQKNNVAQDVLQVAVQSSEPAGANQCA